MSDPVFLPKAGSATDRSRHGITAASLDSQCQYLTVLSIRHFPVEFLVFQFGLLSCWGHHWESPGSPFVLLPIKCLHTSMGSFRAFCRLNNPSSLSLSSYERCSNPLIILAALIWARCGISVSLLYWRAQKWTQQKISHNSSWSRIVEYLQREVPRVII